jgi:hypothetical protein
MKARIFQKPKSAMQSGNTGWGKSAPWVMEPVRQHKASADTLMGWQSSGETMKTLHLSFETLDAAMAYANTNNIETIVIPAPQRHRKFKAYADNFDFNRKQSWTH